MANQEDWEVAYPVIEIDGAVSRHPTVEIFTLSNGVEIETLTVGEQGRGRSLGVLPVAGIAADAELRAARIGETKSGKPKLFAANAPTTTEKYIVVLRTDIGFRGHNSHTGDRHPEGGQWVCKNDHAHTGWSPEQPPQCPLCKEAGLPDYDPEVWDWETKRNSPPEWRREFLPWPAERTLVEGMIAQGDAGRMGDGQQFIAVIPEKTVFRTGYSGRLYGAPGHHYHWLIDGRCQSLTWDERSMLDQW